MTPKIKELAVRAGFTYDTIDCNFYGEGWLNAQISELVALTASEIFKDLTILQYNEMNTSEYFKLRMQVLNEKFGIPKNNSAFILNGTDYPTA